MHKKLFLLILILSGYSALFAQNTILGTREDTLSYCFGLLIGHNLHLQKVEGIQNEIFTRGFEDGLSQAAPAIGIDQANLFIQDYFNNLAAAESGDNLARGKAFLEENGNKEGIVTLPSGLQYKVLVEGAGDTPGETDVVKVHYTGTLISGSVFDSSVERGEPIEFPVNGVIQGWSEALQLMKEGSKWMLYIPSSLAYGENGAGGVIGPNETLIFEVELLEVVKK
jgi:FKBP-type peptidyl-prolyl cis-trans isomerase FklB